MTVAGDATVASPPWDRRANASWATSSLGKAATCSWGTQTNEMQPHKTQHTSTKHLLLQWRTGGVCVCVWGGREEGTGDHSDLRSHKTPCTRLWQRTFVRLRSLNRSIGSISFHSRPTALVLGVPLAAPGEGAGAGVRGEGEGPADAPAPEGFGEGSGRGEGRVAAVRGGKAECAACTCTGGKGRERHRKHKSAHDDDYQRVVCVG